MADLRKIYIFRDLKELSKKTIGYDKGCGFGLTNENCMGDYDIKANIGTMTKRENYTQCDSGNGNCGPNEFLMRSSEEYKFVTNKQPSFHIGKYDDNWIELCRVLNEIVKPDMPKKPNIFLSGHQHSLQQLFFNLNNKKVEEYARIHRKKSTYKNTYGNNKKKKFGFRNGTCLRIGYTTTTRTVIHGDVGLEEKDINIVSSIPEKEEEKEQEEQEEQEEKEEEKTLEKEEEEEDQEEENTLEKDKYIFLEKGSIKEYLKDTLFLTFKPLNQLLEKKIDGLFMIRHGQALHNYRDLLYEGKIEDSEHLKRFLPPKKSVMVDRSVFFNSCLTDKGLNQAKKLYADLKRYFDNENFTDPNDILISSPMDRTIQTLVEGVTQENEFRTLKERFISMYRNRFPNSYTSQSYTAQIADLGGSRTHKKKKKINSKKNRKKNRRKKHKLTSKRNH